MLVPDGGLLLQVEPPDAAGQGRQATPVRAPSRAVCAGAPHALLHLFRANRVNGSYQAGERGVVIRKFKAPTALCKFIQESGRLARWLTASVSLRFNVLRLCVQLFGAMDWAPSDLLVAFLLAGALQNARRRAAVHAALGLEPDAEGATAVEGITFKVKLPPVTWFRILLRHDLSQQGCGVSRSGGCKVESLEPGIQWGPCSQALWLPLERLSLLMRALASCLGPSAVHTVAGTRGLRRPRAQSWRGKHAGILPHSRVIPDTACVCASVVGRAYG